MAGSLIEDKISSEIEAYPYIIALKNKGYKTNEYCIRKRTLNTAISCIGNLRTVSFEELTSKMFFTCSNEMKYILAFYEQLLYDCVLDRNEFCLTLHDKFKDFAEKVKAKKQVGLVVEFNNLVTQISIKKKFIDTENEDIVKRVFSAYLSLLQQSITYFYDALTEYPIYYDDKAGKFITIKDKYPMIDWYTDEFSFLSMNEMCGNTPYNDKAKKRISKEMYERFKRYGMFPKNAKEIEDIFNSSNNYGNMLMAVLHYMNANTKEIIPKSDEIGAVDFEFPRKWFDTEYYMERLKKRNFVLPPETIKVTLKYANGIKEIYINEVFKDDKVIMLYRMVAERESNHSNTDVCGYYIPSEKFFYSYYDASYQAVQIFDRIFTNRLMEFSESLKNIVLECYFLLTVRRTEEEKTHKKYSLPLIAEEYENVDKVPRWNKQPIISFSVITNDVKTKENGKKKEEVKRTYKQGIYEYDDINISCFMRKLPSGYKVSEEAKINAEKYGYVLEDGYTFVVPFERKQRHIKVIGEE